MIKNAWIGLVLTSFCLLAAKPASAAPIPLNAPGVAHSENFNTLANTGTSSVLPDGWAFFETGSTGNGTYAADNGSLNVGNTYSYGTGSNTERGLGTLNDNDFGSSFGAQFVNDTGDIITGLLVAYRGEVWRLGTLDFVDRLDFQYSLDASSLTTGTWIDYDPLDFSALFLLGAGASTGQHSGNSSPFFTDLGSSIGGLSIPDQSTFWIRWNDFPLLGANDDGLAIDQFQITASITQAPEPSAIALLGGLSVMCAVWRFRRIRNCG